MFDLIVDPIFIEAAQERGNFPGLYVSSAPRRAARLRGQDQVVFFFSQSGTTLLAPNLQQEMLSRLADTYFQSAGSVTSGMRITVERLNDFLLKRNLREARQGGQVAAALAMAVIHGNTLYVLLAGSVRAYLLGGKRPEQFNDPAARSLGQARLVGSRFFTASIASGNSLILAVDPPSEWDAIETRWADWASLSVEALHRRLVGEALDLQAGLVRCMSGKGGITWTPQAQAAKERESAQTTPVRPPEPRPERPTGRFLSGKPLRSELKSPAPAQPLAEPPDTQAEALEPFHAPRPVSVDAPAPGRVTDEVAGPVVEKAAGMNDQVVDETAGTHQQTLPFENPSFAPRVATTRATSRQSGQTAVRSSKRTAEKPPAAPRGPSPAAVAAAKRATGVFGWLRKTWAALGAGLSKLVARAIPGQPVEGLNLSPSTMLFVALAIPLAVVAIAATVYFQRGRGEQYQAYLRTANQFAEQAVAQEDLTLRREGWTQVIFWLDKAGEYGQSDEGDQLRAQAQGVMDEMDGIARLTFLPTGGGSLPEGVNIVRMVATINDVYLLDSQNGQVFRLFRTGQGYELDAQFTCGPGRAGSTIIGPLLDIAAMPPINDFKATVTGIDRGGNLVFCAPGVTGFSSMTLIPPDINWGQITDMVLFQDVLYVLDPQVNAVYRFFGEDGLMFASPPRLFFDVQIPHMADVIDLAADQEYLYLLHADGSMTTCSSAGFSVECSDPAPYGDLRAGRTPDPLSFEGTNFVSMQATQPPDPSLYVLDDQAASIYHFSLRKLNLQRQYRPELQPDYPLPERQATAFVITPNRRAILAFGNQIFFAPLP